jgi:hypothetical protein
MRVASPLSLSRETITTVAFSFAKPIAVALPIPELPPVTKQTLPAMSTLLASKKRIPSLRLVDGWDNPSGLTDLTL